MATINTNQLPASGTPILNDPDPNYDPHIVLKRVHPDALKGWLYSIARAGIDILKLNCEETSLERLTKTNAESSWRLWIRPSNGITELGKYLQGKKVGGLGFDLEVKNG